MYVLGIERWIKRQAYRGVTEAEGNVEKGGHKDAHEDVRWKGKDRSDHLSKTRISHGLDKG